MGLNAHDRDPTVDPGVDFYRFANGGWMDASPIPPGYGAWGAIEEVRVGNEHVLRAVLERAAASPQDDLDRMLGYHFRAGLDVDAVEAQGVSAIQPFLDAIAAAVTHDDVVALLPMLHGVRIFPFFGWEVTVDHDDSGRNLLWLAQAGLGLPDRDSYDAAGESAEALRAAYVDHVAAQLANLGAPGPDAQGVAAGVLELESRLASLRTPPCGGPT